MRDIEVLDFGDHDALVRTTEAVYGNDEPCFQVDGVTNYSDLREFFETLKQIGPKGHQRHTHFNDAFMSKGSEVPQKPNVHIDVSYQGLAVHQNLSGVIPIIMATATAWRRELIEDRNDFDASFFEDSDWVTNVRSGLTVPGRLTVFSEGNAGGRDKPFKGLLPTVHLFDRSQIDTEQPALWTRYTTSESWIMHALLSHGRTARVKKNAKASFEILAAATTP